MKKYKVSVVIPCYNSEKTVASVVEEIRNVMESIGMSWEVVMVADGCRDNTFSVISELARDNDNMTAVCLAKNSGQYAALLAGFAQCRGELIATCEDDGQTDVSAYPEMIKKLLDEDLDVVTVTYASRKQPNPFRRLGTKVAVVMSKAMIKKPKNVGFTITFVARRFVIDEMIRYRQPYPYIEGMVFRTTQNVGNVRSVQKGRAEGKSGYNLRKLFELWMNGFTSFSIKPLRISIVIGGIAAALGFLYGLYLVIRKIVLPGIPVGYTSIISVILLLGGIILMVLGVIGEYIGRIYMSINGTPQYVIREIITKEDTEKTED